jgi:hypothetical protein
MICKMEIPAMMSRPLYIVLQAIWSFSLDDRARKLLNRSDRHLFAGVEEAAESYAKQRASEFDLRGPHNESDGFHWWARNKGDKANHRFIVKPAI